MARKPATEVTNPVPDLFAIVEKEASKEFKHHSGSRLSEYNKDMPKIWYSSGIPSLDIALGGGWAGGQASVVWGLPNCGKSTTLYMAIAEAQRLHPEGFHDFHVIADPENSSSEAKAHMELLGVDTSKVFIIAPSGGKAMYAEDIAERLEWILRKPELQGRIGIIGLDSVGALMTRNEGEKKDKWDKAAQVGGISGFLTRFINSLIDSGLLYQSQGHLMLLNQARENIGDIWNPYRMVGGKKIEHACVQAVFVDRTMGQDFKNPLYNSKEPNGGQAEFTGQRIRFKQTKSKVGGRFGATAAVNFYYEHGLDIIQNQLDVAKLHGIIEGTTWLSFIDPTTGEIVGKWQGAGNTKKALSEDKELYMKFDYVLSHTLRGLELLSVVDDWETIKRDVFGIEDTEPIDEKVEENE